MSKTRVVNIGKLAVGGDNPVRIKGMLKSALKGEAIFQEAKFLQQEGAEALRVAFKDEGDFSILKKLNKEINLPLVADIHFNPRLAFRAIEAGFDGIRLNPLNIKEKNEVIAIVRELKKNNMSLRIGVNSGGFRNFGNTPQVQAQEMVKMVSQYIAWIESVDFFDIIVSLKASSVEVTVLANKLFKEKFNYPLHLGVTATGYFTDGIVKSALGIGFLLKENIGDLIRVSLTAESFWEIRVAKSILQSLGLRRGDIEVISCPTCSRCSVDLIELVDKFRNKTQARHSKFSNIKVAIMGCVVNGPGEASQADIGVAFGGKKAALFRKGEIVTQVNKEQALDSLLNLMEDFNECKRS